MAAAEQLVPGVFSVLGRSSEKALTKLRQVAQSPRRRAAALGAAGTAGELGTRSSAAWETVKALTEHSAAGESSPINRGPANATSSQYQPQSVPQNGGTVGLGAQGVNPSQDAEEKTPSPKESAVFTSLGTQSDVFCELSRMKLNRFFRQTGANEQRPEVGRYRPNTTLVQPRTPAWDFAEKRKTQSRSMEVETDIPDSEMLSRFDASRSTLGTPCSCRPGLEQITLASERPDLAKMNFVQMSDLRAQAKDRSEQDRRTSHVPRRPEWDFEKPLGRAADVRDTFYEAGKYDVRYEAVLSSPKQCVGFTKVLSRSTPVLGRYTPSSILVADDESSPCLLDRSLYRLSPCTRPRVTHVRDNSLDLERPPLAKQRATDYDESDPAAVEATLRQEMTLDKSKIDRVVAHRSDYTTNMARSLARGRAGLGARICQDDICIRSMQGKAALEKPSMVEGRTDKTQESSAKPRTDMGLTFDMGTARAPTRKYGKFSSLKQPRSMAAPDFSRAAPQPGFDPRTTVKVPLRKSRTHEALPGWSGESADCLEGL